MKNHWGGSYPIKLLINVALKFDEKKRVMIGDGLTPSYLEVRSREIILIEY